MHRTTPQQFYLAPGAIFFFITSVLIIDADEMPIPLGTVRTNIAAALVKIFHSICLKINFNIYKNWNYIVFVATSLYKWFYYYYYLAEQFKCLLYVGIYFLHIFTSLVKFNVLNRYSNIFQRNKKFLWNCSFLHFCSLERLAL